MAENGSKWLYMAVNGRKWLKWLWMAVNFAILHSLDSLRYWHMSIFKWKKKKIYPGLETFQVFQWLNIFFFVCQYLWVFKVFFFVGGDVGGKWHVHQDTWKLWLKDWTSLRTSSLIICIWETTEQNLKIKQNNCIVSWGTPNLFRVERRGTDRQTKIQNNGHWDQLA